METHGLLAPESEATVRDRYAAVEPAAETATSEVAKALGVDLERVDDDVVLAAREAVFASLLAVSVGTREEYEDWLADRDREVTELGSEHVSGVAWHEARFADAVIAATFESEPEAAVGTLRRQAFARLYREVVPCGA